MTSDVSEVLLSCPFCNGAGHVSRESSFDGWTAKCSNCGIVGAEFGQASNAIAAWNTRAQPVLAVPGWRLVPEVPNEAVLLFLMGGLVEPQDADEFQDAITQAEADEINEKCKADARLHYAAILNEATKVTS